MTDTSVTNNPKRLTVAIVLCEAGAFVNQAGGATEFCLTAEEELIAALQAELVRVAKDYIRASGK